MTIVIPAKLAAEAMGFVSREETRFYLHGFCVDNAGFIVTTDGHRMYVAKPKPGDIILQSDRSNPIIKLNPAMVKACTARPKHGGSSPAWLVILDDASPDVAHIVQASCAEDAAAACSLPGSVLATQLDVFIDGVFPDWRRVLPDLSNDNAKASQSVGFNAAYLGSYAKLSDRSGIVITGTGNGPALIRAIGRDDVFCVLMPMRGGEGDDAFPFKV